MRFQSFGLEFKSQITVQQISSPVQPIIEEGPTGFSSILVQIVSHLTPDTEYTASVELACASAPTHFSSPVRTSVKTMPNGMPQINDNCK